MDAICGLAYRKHRDLTRIEIANGTISIGDAAFSYCASLKKVIIPSSVKYIGVAAFCKSGLVEVIFKGAPQTIEPAIFLGCDSLKKIVVPRGKKQVFSNLLNVDSTIIVESEDLKDIGVNKESVSIALHPSRNAKQTSLIYNYHNFKWQVGDRVLLNELFSGPTALPGNPSYQFRRKVLFIFMHSNIANKLSQSIYYDLPANITKFTRKFQEKYGHRSPRIFIFVHDNDMEAKVYDEVKYIKVNKESITVKSLLR